MESLDTGKDKIKQICEILKNESLEPAKEESQKILEVAEQEARNIIRDAEAKAEQLIHSAKTKIMKDRELFENSLQQAFKQSMETLRQEIEQKLFNSELHTWITQHTAEPQLAAELIRALVNAIEKEGTNADFSVLIPQQIPSEKVNALLLKNILEKLREKSVILGDFFGGVQLKLHGCNMTLDLSDTALKELIGRYVRKDFREILFKSTND